MKGHHLIAAHRHDVTASMATSGTQDVTKIRADLTAQFETEKQKLIEQYEQKLAAVQVRFRFLVSGRCCSFSGSVTSKIVLVFLSGSDAEHGSGEEV